MENEDAAAAWLMAPTTDQLTALQRQMTTVTGPRRPSPAEVVKAVESPVAAESSSRRASSRTSSSSAGPSPDWRSRPWASSTQRGADEPRRRSKVGTRFPQSHCGSVRKKTEIYKVGRPQRRRIGHGRPLRSGSDSGGVIRRKTDQGRREAGSRPGGKVYCIQKTHGFRSVFHVCLHQAFTARYFNATKKPLDSI